MNPGQKMFYDFFMERVKDDKKKRPENIGKVLPVRRKELLTRLILREMPEFFAVIKPEAEDELKQAMDIWLQHYKS